MTSHPHPLDPAGARIVDRLHARIADLIDGNHVRRAEVQNIGARSCPCHIACEIDWAFNPVIANERLRGNHAVSTHHGHDRVAHDAETAHRSAVARTHRPIREAFMARVVAAGAQGLADSGTARQVWDFGQHSVHEQCSPCHGSGQVDCSSCHGRRRTHCHQCAGAGHTTETRWVADHRGHGHNETYEQSCYGCGGSGTVTCRHCNGSGEEQCNACGGHGFYTDITSVTVQAVPHVQVTTHSALSSDALPAYLGTLPVARIAEWLDFTFVGHHDANAQTWRVGYETHTTVVELDVQLRKKAYLAAAVGDKALAFIRPPIFDDVFIEEITDLHTIWSGKKRETFNNHRARAFFTTYAGQPVLDRAMKAVAKLHKAGPAAPQREVVQACDGYISAASAQLLSRAMVTLLDKVSPPYSVWSWAAVMAVPFGLLLLVTQNAFELRPPGGYLSGALGFAWISFLAAAGTVLLSPVAALVSAVVSAIRRRSVPREYRQHGRNWQPLKAFMGAAAVFACMGGALGLATHHALLPRWNNQPLRTLDEALQVRRLIGTLWGTPPAAALPAASFESPLVSDVQRNLLQLGYAVPVDGHFGESTRSAVNAYMQQKKRKARDLRTVLRTLCGELKGRCINASEKR